MVIRSNSEDPWLADVPTLSHHQPRVTTGSSVTSIQDGASCVSSPDCEDAEMTDGSSEPTVTDGLDKLHLRRQSARAPLHQEITNGARNGKRKLGPQTPPPMWTLKMGIRKNQGGYRRMASLRAPELQSY
ncbi:hypothetical protein BDR07DRAFT_1399121, partial [Suillus spraguei]